MSAVSYRTGAGSLSMSFQAWRDTPIEDDAPAEDDLLAIPAFLVRGSPENAEALAAGERALADRPRTSVARVKIAPVAPSKTERKRTKRDADAEVRRALLKADFSPGFVARCPIAKARRILSDLAAGLGAPREDQI